MSARDDFPHPMGTDQLFNNQRTWERMCTEIDRLRKVEQQLAEAAYPNHAPETALANYRAGHEVWDTNGEPW